MSDMGITRDFGTYDCPDDLIKEHLGENSAFKAAVYRRFGRHLRKGNIKK